MKLIIIERYLKYMAEIILILRNGNYNFVDLTARERYLLADTIHNIPFDILSLDICESRILSTITHTNTKTQNKFELLKIYYNKD